MRMPDDNFFDVIEIALRLISLALRLWRNLK
jgi:hypothetical protein